MFKNNQYLIIDWILYKYPFKSFKIAIQIVLIAIFFKWLKSNALSNAIDFKYF